MPVSDEMNRRTFLAAAGSTAAGMGAAFAQTPAKAKDQVIGIQIGAASFVDEGTEKVLDVLQERAYVNTLFLATFTYGRGISGRQIKGFPFPDHGVQAYDDNFHGGNYATPHTQYYKNTVLKDTKAPDFGKLDILETVIPAAKKRGIKTYCWSEDVWRPDVPNIEKCNEVSFDGTRARTVCFNNPDHHNFLLGLMEDLTRSYDIDGIMWGSERYGAFCNSFESIHQPKGNDPAKVTCFCRFCREKAKKRGINVDRAMEGFKMLHAWVNAARASQRPVDGYYVTFWRILFRYPELLAWETMWNESVHETYEAIYKTVKSARPSVQVGWHVWHAHSFSPFFRALTDLKEISQYSDYLKMTAYHNAIGGPRMAIYMDSVADTVFHDMPKDEALAFEEHVMNYREADSVEKLYRSALSPDYVYRETKRSVEGVAGSKTQIWPGIDVDIPSGSIPPEAHVMKCTPEGTKAVVLAAYRGGAQGLVISRKYSEMMLANLGGVGEALRELKLV
jgi:hypothetical protein